ncbi:tetratricopeptide repeat protein [Pseudogracilibacillus auburnensis]|uniref:Tetratricopeptide repeat protein n=1 Tax=Pseudogracilibacillus auburnensis TaxID=1494959 RepID=A0A2V3VP20_9BACI|nr:tetratricopeptide repeat protein [Pseudogracilibacillus auburnensis]PXW82601.1 tetratricopeptide repeat protein [Pseudogracilibacillus auburnensis]
MNEEVNKAIELREKGELKEANTLLVKLVQEFPDDAYIHFQCAWSFDVLGEEIKAVPYYEAAINLGLSNKDVEKAIIGLGSTYRTIGEYKKSQETFLKGMKLFPENKVIQVFYSMTLYNLKEHQKAMELLLSCLMETTSDDEILSYQKAINFYKDNLNEVWR